jgi:hypothetical protein
MNDIQHFKTITVIPPAAIVNNASFTTAEIDTLGFKYATFLFTMGATDIAMTELKVQHSASSGSGFGDVAGADFDGGTDIDGGTAALPSATDDNKTFVLQLDLRSKNRYLDLVATVGNGSTGAFGSCVCLLTAGEQIPTSIADVGAGSVIRVA